MWNNPVELGRLQVTILRMRIACWISKATHTHTLTICNTRTYCYSTANTFARTRLLFVIWTASCINRRASSFLYCCYKRKHSFWQDHNLRTAGPSIRVSLSGRRTPFLFSPVPPGRLWCTSRRRLSRYHVKAAATWSWPHTACSVGGKNEWCHTSVPPDARTSSWRAQGPLELVFVNYWGRIISYFKLILSHLVVYRVLAK
jgi:hypothetical protein